MHREAAKLTAVIEREESFRPRSNLVIHFLRLDVGLLQKIGDTANGEDARENASKPRSEEEAVDKSGGDPGAEAKRQVIRSPTARRRP